MWETLKTTSKYIMKQHFQDMAQEVQFDKNPDTFEGYSDQRLTKN